MRLQPVGELLLLLVHLHVLEVLLDQRLVWGRGRVRVRVGARVRVRARVGIRD